MNGIILLNKPAELSSNTAVNIVKKAVSAKKAGHLGTLDVLGDGVLPITLGKATRLFDFYLKKTKTYRAVFAFGFETETLDAEGKILKTKNKEITREEIEKVLPKFLGKQFQLPPIFSALKIGGKNAYEIARKGGEVSLKEREIEIFNFKLLEDVSSERKEVLKERFLKFHKRGELEKEEIKTAFEKGLFEFEISCSSGTYIRSLARDLAEKLSTCGTMLCITRTRCGNFELKDTFSLEEIKSGKFETISTFDAIDLPILELSSEDEKNLLDGKTVKSNQKFETGFKIVSNGNLVGIGNNFDCGKIKITTFLKENV